jgi:hypothetical protein
MPELRFRPLIQRFGLPAFAVFVRHFVIGDSQARPFWRIVNLTRLRGQPPNTRLIRGG